MQLNSFGDGGPLLGYAIRHFVGFGVKESGSFLTVRPSLKSSPSPNETPGLQEAGQGTLMLSMFPFHALFDPSSACPNHSAQDLCLRLRFRAYRV